MSQTIVFPGSYNPLHHYHLEMAHYVEKKYGAEVIFEICETPYDKDPLNYTDKKKRKHQFDIIGRKVEFTSCSSFLQKAIHYTQYGKDKVLFIVGSDTLSRIQNVTYYFNSKPELERCLTIIAQRANFIVFPRPKIEEIHPILLPVTTVVNDLEPNDVSSTKQRESSNLYITADDFRKCQSYPLNYGDRENKEFKDIYLQPGLIGDSSKAFRVKIVQYDTCTVTVQFGEEFFTIYYGVRCIPFEKIFKR